MFFKLHFLVDLDTRRILAFAVSDMNGGDAALLPTLLNSLMKKYVGEGIPMQESAFNYILDQMPARTDSRSDPPQKLLDSWTHEDGYTADQKETKKPAKARHGDGDTAGQKETDVIELTEEELHRIESVAGSMLARVRHKLEKKGVHIELRGDCGYDSRQVFSMLEQLGIAPICV